MRRILLALGLVLCLVGVSHAQLCPGINSPLVPYGYESLTVSTTPVGLTVPPNTELALAVLEQAGVRFRDDGPDPTADEGLLLQAGGSVVICSRSLEAIRFIRDAAVDGVLKIAYYGR